MVVLYKKRNQTDPLNYRTITLIKVITKIFTQILNKRITFLATTNNLLLRIPNWFPAGKRMCG